MASLKHFLVAAVAGLVVLTTSVSTDAAAVPVVISSAGDALPDADLTSALARFASIDDATTNVKAFADADAAVSGDEEALALVNASGRAFKKPHPKCKKLKKVKVCKRVKFLCKKKFSVHALDAADADDGGDAVDEAIASDAGNMEADDVDVNATDRQHKKHKTFKKKVVIVKKKVVVFKPKFCFRPVCKVVKKCVHF